MGVHLANLLPPSQVRLGHDCSVWAKNGAGKQTPGLPENPPVASHPGWIAHTDVQFPRMVRTLAHPHTVPHYRSLYVRCSEYTRRQLRKSFWPHSSPQHTTPIPR